MLVAACAQIFGLLLTSSDMKTLSFLYLDDCQELSGVLDTTASARFVTRFTLRTCPLCKRDGAFIVVLCLAADSKLTMVVIMP
jgi:hypothetical protein